MQIKIIKPPTTPKRIPEVGELWCHDTDTNCVYTRIRDDTGRKIFGEDDNRNYFYSFCLNDGLFAVTGLSGALNITILKQVEPLKLEQA